MTFRVVVKSLAITLTFCMAAYSKPKAAKTYGNLCMSFEANTGQTDPHVRFLSRGSGYNLFLAPNEAVIRLQRANKQAVVRMRMLGAKPNVRMVGKSELPGKSNYFIGNDPAKWRTGVPTYSKVTYEGLYPGIDLVYYGNQGRLEYDFVVSPGADPRQIALDVMGRLKVDGHGDLVLPTNAGEVLFQKPVAYQLTAGGRKTVIAAAYALNAINRVSFLLGAYDRTKPIIIDPVLSYSTYLGGSGDEVVGGMAVDAAGNAYLTGETLSVDFPTVNPIQPTNGGYYDGYITKINPAGTAIVYSTYLGGSAFDGGYDIAVDSSGNAYVAGVTYSSNFPVFNAFQGALNGPSDAFLTKLNAAGDQIVYSTFLGGSSSEYGIGVTVDSSGSAYLVGQTISSDFPVVTPIQILSGNWHGFVSKFNASGSALVYSTYLGGSGYDQINSVAVDHAFNAYVTGLTGSTNFPTVNPIQAFNAGGTDVFVSKINAAGSALVYSTYLGGSGTDYGLGLALDGSGNAYVSGYTASTDFPLKRALQPTYGGGGDAFVTKINSSGSALVYSTYLGGRGLETPDGYPKTIAVDRFGNAYVAGSTYSKDFPTSNPTQALNAGGSDAFVTKLNAAGSALIYSSYLGGNNNEDYIGMDGAHIAIDSAGNIYVYGNTLSTNFPTVNPIQATLAGGYDAFLTKISSGVSLSKKKLTFSTQLVGTSSNAMAITVTNLGNNTLTITNVAVTGTDAADFGQTNTCSTVAPNGTCTIDITFTPLASGTLTADIAITDNEIDSPQMISLTGTGTEVSLAPTRLNFGKEKVGSASHAKTVTLTNAGSATLNITSITIIGADPGDFAIPANTNTCGATLGVGASCTIGVTFTPTTTGTRTATLSFADDGGGSPQSVALTGTGM